MAEELDKGGNTKFFLLKQANRDNWFQTIKDLAESYGRHEALELSEEDSCQQYATILVQAVPNFKELPDWSKVPDSNPEQWRSSKKAMTYRANAAWVSMRIRHNLTETDQDLIEECTTNKDRIAKLKRKYYKTTAVAGNTALKELTQFKMDTNKDIDENWALILRNRRTAHMYSDDTKFSDNITFSFFLEGLTDHYSVTKQTINAQPEVSIETKLQLLQERCAENGSKKDPKAFIAEDNYAYYSKQGISTDGRAPYNCWVCDSGDHGARMCPYKREANAYAKKRRLEDERTGTKPEDRRSSPSPPASPQGRSFQRRSSNGSNVRRSQSRDRAIKTPDRLSGGKKKSSMNFKNFRKALMAAGLFGSDDDNEESDNESIEEEFAQVSQEYRKIPRSEWIADSGCSSHMTDKPELFRNQIKPYMVPIRVGGGVLWSEGKGTAEVKFKDGQCIYLAECLFVPELGANLLAGRKLCINGDIFGAFTAEKMMFLKDDKPYLEADHRNGIYVLSTCYPEAQNKCFYTKELIANQKQAVSYISTQQIETPAITEEPMDEEPLTQEVHETEVPEPEEDRGRFPQISRSNKNQVVRKTKKDAERAKLDAILLQKEVQEQNIRDRYHLMHRRFGHANPKVLAALHRVANIKEIKIPTKIPVCGTCARTKMRKKKSKKLAEHKDEVLALVSLDVAGPFLRSYRGYKYFAELIDNYTRMTWTIPMKSRDEIYEKLDEWVVQVERQTKKKLVCTRTDNAPELLKELQGWKRKDGVTVQVTETHTSHQNGPAERSIQYTENNIRAMIDDAGLPAEFWCEAAEAQAYHRNRQCRGPVVEREENGKKLSAQLSPIESYTGKRAEVDHLRTWGCKAYSHVSREELPKTGRTDKLMPVGRDCVFMGYDWNTTKHYRVYAPDLHRTTISSSVDFDESVKGGTIPDFKLWIELTDGTFQEAEGTPNVLPERRRVGRPSKETISGIPTPVPAFQSPSFIPKQVRFEDEVEKVVTKEDEPPVSISEGDLVKDDDPALQNTLRINVPTYPVYGMDSLDPEPLKTASQAADTTAQVSPTIPPASGNLKRSHEDESDTPSKKIPDPVRSTDTFKNIRYNLRGSKRRFDDNEAENESFVKKQKAMLAMLQWCLEPGETAMKAIAGMVCGIDIPVTYEEALKGPYAKQWKEAIDIELAALVKNGTWKEVIPPGGANLISTKWVFDIKTPDGKVLDRFKARLVARGFSQKYGVDYTETFAPTVRMATLRTFFAITAVEDRECRHYDIGNAFTESECKEDLFLSKPKGVNVTEGYVLKVLRSIYGLKQAARDWNKLLKSHLIDMGFEQSLGDPCLFTHAERGIVILVYVDDILASAKKGERHQLDWFYRNLHVGLDGRFNTKDLGEVKKILGIRVTRNRSKRYIELDQTHYLEKVLSKFGYTQEKHKGVTTPCENYENLRPAGPKDKRIDPTWYREVIGSLMYAMIYTRIDIAFILGRLAQYMQDPAEHHKAALSRVLRYLRSTIEYRICFGPSAEDKPNLVVYSDADYASDKIDRKSITASVGLVGGGPVFWGSKKQKSVATATTEAEYMAMANTAKQGQWVAQILRDMGFPEYIAPNGFTVDTRGDNQGAIALAKNPQLTDRSKHIDVAYHYIRDLQERQRVDISYVPTDEMAADGLTKPVSRPIFDRFRKQVGMVLPRVKNQWEYH